MRTDRFGRCLLLLAVLLALGGCATTQSAKVVRFDKDDPGQRMVGGLLATYLRNEGRDLKQCKLGMLDTQTINAASYGECRFTFTTGLANTRDAKLIATVVAHEVAHDVLGHADQRKGAIAASQLAILGTSLIPGVGGLIASTAVAAGSWFVLPAYSRHQEAEADERAVEIMRRANFRDPEGTAVYAFETLLVMRGTSGGGLLDSHPSTEDRIAALRKLQGQEAKQDTVITPATASQPPPPAATERTAGRAEPAAGPGMALAGPGAGNAPPVYALGQRWLRDDGEYRLVRIENDQYVFANDKGFAIYLTKELVVAAAKAGAYKTEFIPPLRLAWPLRVGSWGQGRSLWHLPLDPTRLDVKYTWSVEAFEEVRVGAGIYKAFRVVFEWEPAATDVVTISSFPKKRLILWYAPEAQQLVKGAYSTGGPLTFEVLGVVIP